MVIRVLTLDLSIKIKIHIFDKTLYCCKKKIALAFITWLPAEKPTHITSIHRDEPGDVRIEQVLQIVIFPPPIGLNLTKISDCSSKGDSLPHPVICISIGKIKMITNIFFMILVLENN